MLAQPILHPPFPELSYNPQFSSPSAAQVRPKPQTAETQPFNLRAATVEDASAIAELGASVFSTTFGFSIPTKDLAAYLNEAYSITALQEDILSSKKHVIVACEPADGHVIGFAQLTEGTSEPCIEDLANIVELQRLYVHADYHGLGLGKALTQWTEKIALDKGYQTMWLGVWEGNFQAQRIYEAMGFSRVGEHEFQMGRCIQTDWIMCKGL